MKNKDEQKEQRRKAQKRYYEKNKEYYKKRSLEESKRVRKERKLYKEIIKEAREYIKNNAMYSESEKICCDDLYTTDCDKVLEILDKENKNESNRNY